MNWQIVIVGVIVLLAFIYIGSNVRRKVKSFSSASKSSSCGSDCGCGNPK